MKQIDIQRYASTLKLFRQLSREKAFDSPDNDASVITQSYLTFGSEWQKSDGLFQDEATDFALKHGDGNEESSLWVNGFKPLSLPPKKVISPHKFAELRELAMNPTAAPNARLKAFLLTKIREQWTPATQKAWREFGPTLSRELNVDLSKGGQLEAGADPTFAFFASRNSQDVYAWIRDHEKVDLGEFRAPRPELQKTQLKILAGPDDATAASAENGLVRSLAGADKAYLDNLGSQAQILLGETRDLTGRLKLESLLGQIGMPQSGNRIKKLCAAYESTANGSTQAPPAAGAAAKH